ncbi:MAG: hypothetical protein ABII90_03210 [Bacteroidota bacterium]
MKILQFKALIPIILAAFFLTACVSSKKHFQRGQYDLAVKKSVKKLRKNPTKEGEIIILEKAFNKANERDNDRINFLKLEGTADIWDEIFDKYSSMKNRQALVKSVVPLEIPSTGRIVNFSFVNYDEEIINAKKKAAEYLYAHAQTLLEKNDRESAKKAYYELLRVKGLYANYKDVDEQIKKAKFLATLKVVAEPIPMHSRTLELSNEFFDNKINEFLGSMPASEFVRFYTPKEVTAVGLEQPDHIIKIKFDDFIVGQTILKENVIQASKDSVPFTVTLADGTKQTAYQTVKAQMHLFKKTLISKGLLDFQIYDPNANRTLTQEKFPGEFVWFCEWGYFNGDERALDAMQKKAAKGKEMPPPPPQDLFLEFTKPIYQQLTDKIKAFYRNY